MAAILISQPAVAREAIALKVPKHKVSQTLVASTNLDERRYIAFPVTIRTAPDELLIAFKRGSDDISSEKKPTTPPSSVFICPLGPIERLQTLAA
jgi:hypothetical protein